MEQRSVSRWWKALITTNRKSKTLLALIRTNSEEEGTSNREHSYIGEVARLKEVLLEPTNRSSTKRKPDNLISWISGATHDLLSIRFTKSTMPASTERQSTSGIFTGLENPSLLSGCRLQNNGGLAETLEVNAGTTKILTRLKRPFHLCRKTLVWGFNLSTANESKDKGRSDRWSRWAKILSMMQILEDDKYCRHSFLYFLYKGDEGKYRWTDNAPTTKWPLVEKAHLEKFSIGPSTMIPFETAREEEHNFIRIAHQS
jgi:hypothetical protein